MLWLAGAHRHPAAHGDHDAHHLIRQASEKRGETGSLAVFQTSPIKVSTARFWDVGRPRAFQLPSSTLGGYVCRHTLSQEAASHTACLPLPPPPPALTTTVLASSSAQCRRLGPQQQRPQLPPHRPKPVPKLARSRTATAWRSWTVRAWRGPQALRAQAGLNRVLAGGGAGCAGRCRFPGAPGRAQRGDTGGGARHDAAARSRDSRGCVAAPPGSAFSTADAAPRSCGHHARHLAPVGHGAHRSAHLVPRARRPPGCFPGHRLLLVSRLCAALGVASPARLTTCAQVPPASPRRPLRRHPRVHRRRHRPRSQGGRGAAARPRRAVGRESEWAACAAA